MSILGNIPVSYTHLDVYKRQVGGFSGRLDFHVVHQLLTTGQPDVGGDNALMGSQHQHLVFQVVLFAGLHIPPLIQIAAIHAGKIGSVIDNDCPLTFEKFVHIKVCLLYTSRCV